MTSTEPYLAYGPLKGGTGPAVPNPDATGDVPLHVVLTAMVDPDADAQINSPRAVRARAARNRAIRARVSAQKLEEARARVAQLDRYAPRKRAPKGDAS